MLCIAGKSCSGKDTIAKELQGIEYKKLTTFTTRPIRPNEVVGINYHYITIEEFLNKAKSGFFLETKFYNVVDGIWYYGSSIDSYREADDNTLCILTPSGLRKLRENNIPYTAFYISVSDDVIKARQKLRKDVPEEAKRRFISDQIDFADIEDLIDYTIINENRSAKFVAEEINKIYRRLNG